MLIRELAELNLPRPDNNPRLRDSKKNPRFLLGLCKCRSLSPLGPARHFGQGQKAPTFVEPQLRQSASVMSKSGNCSRLGHCSVSAIFRYGFLFSGPAQVERILEDFNRRDILNEKRNP